MKTITRSLKFLAALAALSAITVVSWTHFAPASRAQSSNTDIQNLLGQVGAAYRNLRAFAAIVETTQRNGSEERKVTAKLTLVKPGKLAADVRMGSDTAHIVADGMTVFMDSSRDKTRYLKQPATKLEDAVMALGRGGGAGIGLLPILLTAANAEKQIIPGKPGPVKRLPDETIGGTACDVISAVVGEGARTSRFNYAFGKQDHLLRRLTIGPDKEGEKPSIVETYSNVTLQPTVTDALFKYTPLPGAVAASAPIEPEMFDPRLKAGAVPLTITGNDLSGKAVSLDQYKGKVLLIDFWATWCGPCVAELPNVIAAYNKYHSRGFEILGVTLDEANSRQKLDSFMASRKMTWRQIYDGKGWEAVNAKAYGVHGIPFTLLVGRNGKIAAVGARGEALAPAIEAALLSRLP